MRAVVYERYGGPEVLRLVEVEPPIPGDGQMLVRVRASSVNPVDYHLMRGQPFLARILFGGLRRPKHTRPGRDFAGVVEAVDPRLTGFAPGDEVFGYAPGAYGELLLATNDQLVRKPADLSYEEAAAVPVAGVTAVQALRDVARLQQAQRLLVNGASGGVGSFAVQVAKAWGATVTAVTSTRNVERVRELGADEVVDYTREDFVAGGRRFDVVFDNVGNRSDEDLARVTVPGGVVVQNGGAGNTAQIVAGMALTAIRNRGSSIQFKGFLSRPGRADLEVLRELLASGQVRPLIDRSFRLEEIRDAVRYAETFHARGKVIVTI